jgi:hypothetical protein
MKKQLFNKFNPQDLFSQLVKVLSQKDSDEMKEIIRDLRSLSSKVFKELKTPVMQEANMKNVTKIAVQILNEEQKKDCRKT